MHRCSSQAVIAASLAVVRASRIGRSGSLHVRLFFFFNDTATTEIYTLSLHDALPISAASRPARGWKRRRRSPCRSLVARSEEHTSELQSRQYLVCRLLLEKTKKPRLNRATVDSPLATHGGPAHASSL